MRDFAEMENNNKAKARCHEAASDEAEVDRLSKLPDHVLLNILERVRTIDALRTCILSKRMLKLPPMLSLLDIDIGSLARYIKPKVDTTNRIFQYNTVVAAIIEKVLSARNPEIPIRKLRVRFCLRPDECLSISQVVAHAMATQKLDVAEFVVLTETICLKCTEDHLLCYAKHFNSWLGDCPAVFAGLTRLWLRNMRFGELDIPNILSACKRLESLRLSYCDAGVQSVLQVEHAQLVELHIDYGEFEAVQLSCLPKLQRVKYLGWSYQRSPDFWFCAAAFKANPRKRWC
uniref:F-box domain-containing protein n=1 Tax=Triticum urartu TaxID=4572 RepID=A0A8R7V1L1_TRIUA